MVGTRLDLRMDDSRTARQATQWELKGYKRKQGRPRKNWVDVIKRDLKDMDLTWDEAETGERQSRLASTCGPMHSPECGMN